MSGQGPATVGVEGTGDPAMVLEAPVQQHRTQHDVYVPDTYPQNFLNVVAPTGVALTLDGQLLRGAAESLGDFAVYAPPVAPGAHRVRSADARPLGVKVYGITRYTSYMYPGRLDLRPLPPR